MEPHVVEACTAHIKARLTDPTDLAVGRQFSSRIPKRNNQRRDGEMATESERECHCLAARWVGLHRSSGGQETVLPRQHSSRPKHRRPVPAHITKCTVKKRQLWRCLLYTSDAADE